MVGRTAWPISTQVFIVSEDEVQSALFSHAHSGSLEMKGLT